LVIGVIDVLLSARRRRSVADAPQGTPEPEPPAVAGTVTDPAGVAVPAIVTLTSPGGQQVARTTTDAQGRFALAAEPGSYLLLVAAPDLRPVVRQLRVNGEPLTTDVTMLGSAGLSGLVHAGQGPVQGALVTLLDRGGQVRHATTTGADGRYLFDGVRPGEYTLIAAGYAPTSSLLHIAAGAQVEHDAVL
jgi:hypothetical protein